MNRLKFLATFLLTPLAFAQSKVNKNQIQYKSDNLGTIPLQDVKILGNYGASDFLEIRLGAGIAAQMKTVGTESFIELTATPSQVTLPKETILNAARVSNNRYSVAENPEFANRTLKVFYNGLLEQGFTRDGEFAVIFNFVVEDSAIITFVYSGI